MRQLILGAIALAIASTTAHAEPVTLKFGHAATTSNPRQTAALKFAEVVAKKSNGNITVKVMPNGEAGDDAAMLKALKAGTLDITANSQGPTSKEIPEVAALGMPFLFSSAPKAWQVLDGPIGKELAEKSQAKGYIWLGSWDNGIRQMTNNVHPVLKPEDLKGLKMRTPPDPITVDIMTALGSEPQQIKFTELFGALKAGVVDGQENPLVNIDAGKLYEVQKYVSLTGHKYEVTPVLISKSTWDKLSDADHKILQEAAKEATALQRKLAKEADDTLLVGLKEKGMKIDKVDHAAFVKATAGVTDKWLASDIGPFAKKVVAAAK